MKRRQLLALGQATSLGIYFPQLSAAEVFPNRTVSIIDPATPGSSTDLFSRALAQEMGKLRNEVVLVENKTGAAGAIAAEYVAKSKPDGHTLALATVSAFVSNPAVNPNLRYDPVKDFSAVTSMVTLPSATVVSSDSKFRTLEELIAAAKREPGSISFASPGIGSAGHILMEQFSSLASAKFLHVPYRGSAEMYKDLLGGQLAVISDNISSLVPFINSGKLRVLAVRDLQRSELLPQIPTYAELGFQAVSYPLWFGLVAPAGTPASVISQLNEWAHQAMRRAAFLQQLSQGGASLHLSTPDQFRNTIAEWGIRFKAIVESVKIRPV